MSFEPNDIDPGDIVHTSPPAQWIFAATVLRQLEESELATCVSAGDDTWFWVFGGSNSVVDSLQRGRNVFAIPASSIVGLIKAHANRAAIAALLPTQVCA